MSENNLGVPQDKLRAKKEEAHDTWIAMQVPRRALNRLALSIVSINSILAQSRFSRVCSSYPPALPLALDRAGWQLHRHAQWLSHVLSRD